MPKRGDSNPQPRDSEPFALTTRPAWHVAGHCKHDFRVTEQNNGQGKGLMVIGVFLNVTPK